MLTRAWGRANVDVAPECVDQIVISQLDRLVRAGLHDRGLPAWLKRAHRPVLESNPRFGEDLGQGTLR